MARPPAGGRRGAAAAADERGKASPTRPGRALPRTRTSRGVLASDRAALEGDRAACVEATRVVLDSSFHDPEGRFSSARNLVHVGERDLGLETLLAVCARGFCVDRPIERDPWLEPVREDPRYRKALEIARTGRLAATEAYRAAGGEALLGPA